MTKTVQDLQRIEDDGPAVEEWDIPAGAGLGLDIVRADSDRRMVAYSTVDQLSPDQFRRLIDGPLAPGRERFLASIEADDARASKVFDPDEELDGVQVFYEDDGTVTAVFPSREYFAAVWNGETQMVDPNTTATVGDVLRSLGGIVVTLFRIARAWVKGIP